LVALLLGLVLLAWLLPGCGSAGAHMSAATASTLQRDVDAVTSATTASQWNAAANALDRLEGDVAAAQAAGALSEQQAAQIRAARLRVLEDVQRIRAQTPSPTPAPTPSRGSPTTRPAPSAGPDGNGSSGDSKDNQPGKQNDNKNKAQKGKGKGNGKKG
jgi:hypothetical protein